jgi:hypothetical protein
MEDLNAFAQECHDISHSKGWTALKRTDTQLCNLMISECIEALEDFRNNRKIDELYYEAKTKNGEVQILTWEQTQDPGSQQYKSIKPCGIPIEIADFIIRCGQYFGTNQLNLAASVANAEGTAVEEDFNEMLADVMQCICLARLASPEQGHEKDRMSMTNYLGEAFFICTEYCTKNNIDLWAAVKEKNEYNATREKLHGGKRI